ncbi:acyl-CoA dehydratase activase-related protein [Halanaerobium congolense]|jgi:predicted nucleotide-binding protein (sugar kinase/HSP70/actin superfamily)|uniref:Predicted nucleotide-binding protein, sugar kinase/HSP70/actin superfamily n=1 Tax=Halanaerobium congolense TaxID=54121 RepID=A0A1G6M3M5_9FIRM|nr:acyl-CoA dehydratase activase-related protein [Halanaerobium congolense]KXS48447.1 MAG: hypothetical protein AWL62_1913 [Halanaerobium sp. T82-1]OEG62128.1 MAG: hypothetical protein BHK79_07330 [Halanaerobium sp. MDAL1]PUU90089.1 MAG: hypothetical protein CI948_1672 [Halanaerobium sp.]PTX16618.1 putative nucleotide-binding protein (sugar kinase/HSP70/actin superfamily) [Halanaerobium congolense]PXV65349.1 putative nucleotide-binding protein (sugar kinase/HSP70/actin superfamily) [Halanaerob
MRKKSIGIPRALLYYYYFPFWLKLFSELNLKTVISDNTSRDLLDQGVKKSLSEICVPIKVIIGHILNLDQKDVDYIFLPRFRSLRKNVVLCPKFLGLPDMVSHSLPSLKAEIIADQIDAKSDDIAQYFNHQKLAKTFNIPKREMKKALNKASSFWQRYRNLLFEGYLIDDFSNIEEIEILEKLISKFENSSKPPSSKKEELKIAEKGEVLDIALIGYVYNVFDQYINMDIINKLKEMGVRVHTFSMAAEEIVEKELSKLRKPMFWEFTNKLYGAAEHYLKNDKIDGLIHLTAFGCGPDSMLGQILEVDAKEYEKTFMTLRIDEQTGESHIMTRIEAFIDLLRLKKEKK